MTKQGKMWTWIVVVIIVIGGIWYLFANNGSGSNSTGYTAPEQNTQSNQTSGTEGRVVFSVTDAAVNMSTISQINMKVSSVEMHSAGDGWVTVSTTPQTFDLLSLNAKNESDLLSDTTAKAGTYDQVRLMVDSVIVKTKAGATATAKLPSGQLTLNTKVVVNANNTASVNLDVLADKSLHTTGNGDFIFAPVVKTTSESNATIDVSANNAVSISGGNQDDLNTQGMDVDGSVKLNFQINDKLPIILKNNTGAGTNSKSSTNTGTGNNSVNVDGNSGVNVNPGSSLY